MRRKSFGGNGTEEKLDRLAKYLKAYTTIFTRNVWAQQYTTIYVDAFASTGVREAVSKEPQNSGLFPELAEADAQQFFKGSVRRALEVQPRFNQYLFIELDPKRCQELANLKTEYPDQRV
jgi:three-Cys-motif partner protein